MYYRFFAKIFIIILPFVSFIGILTNIAFEKGDAIPPYLAIEYQQENRELIYMPVWTRNDHYYYKFAAINYIQPEILIMGSSRVRSLRPEYMFTEINTGYNAGITAANPYEISLLFEAIENSHNLPEIVLLTIDDLFFNSNGTYIQENAIDRVTPPIGYNYNYVFSAVRETAKNDYAIRPFSILNFYLDYDSSLYLGNVAQNSHRGYRYDGTFIFPDLADLTEGMIEQQDLSFNNSEGIFEHGDTVDEEYLDAINNILQIASQNSVLIVGIYLPYRTHIYEELMYSDNFTFVPQLRLELNTLFNEYDMPLLDFSLPQNAGGSDEELYDYWHPGEVLSLRIYLEILKALPDIFLQYSDINQIQFILDTNEDIFNLP